MDLEKKYFDSNDNVCNILQMVEKEPEWAANRIQEGEKATNANEQKCLLCESGDDKKDYIFFCKKCFNLLEKQEQLTSEKLTRLSKDIKCLEKRLA